MLNIYISLIVVLLGLTSCNTNGNVKEYKVSIVDSSHDPPIGEVNKIVGDTDLTTIKGLSLPLINSIKILSFYKDSKNDTADNEFLEKCKGWSLSEREIISLFHLFKPIDRHEFNYQFYVLPCEIQGNVLLDNKRVRFLINAGSYMKLFGSDTTLLFGCSTKKCSQFFLTESE